MSKNNWIIIGIVIAIAILYWYWNKNRFIASKLEPTTDNDWDSKKFVVRSPFGRLVIQGNEPSGIVVQDENYEIGTRTYADFMEVYMAHKNESDPYYVSMITYDYVLKTVLPEYREA